MFPFLIGRIRTVEKTTWYRWLSEGFPFLIGRIRTVNFLDGTIAIGYYVSIPHR